MEPFLGEIRMFAGNYPPRGWALCNGQLLAISQNTALFSILGTTYGGDGRSNFALPNLQGSIPVHPGQGPGLSTRWLGETGGSPSESLLNSEIPQHAHTLNYGDSAVPQSAPNGALPSATRGRRAPLAYVAGQAGQAVTLHPQTIALAGGSLPHNNMQPYLTVNFIIALSGIFPPRS
ncbi:phage tail protein [Paenibacillus protaetiae]|uniref:Phage tail protein n=1 Tax=Paenibacillus protaetiae TaxID=2509456 RepID=A0A4P6EWS8_9BACL|nr:tail fiber protein [Paenibacillus protaetiae]QAY67085.1 phage tail protein [Paenibacillus protaetiae]